MKSSLESIRLRRPCRAVNLVAVLSPAEAAATEQHAREQAAYERGRRDAERAWGEQVVRQRAELLELQNGTLDSLQQVIPRLRQACEQELISLALEVAHKLVAGLPVSAEMVQAVVREALAQVEVSTALVVELNPADLALLERVNSPLRLPGGGVERVSFHASEAVTRGGCLVRTRFGTIDARRETKLEMLKQAILS
jgi:flagellar assembly protein FliH